MEAREFWDAVKHEVRDLLAPNAATRAVVRRDETTSALPSVVTGPDPNVDVGDNIVLAPTLTTSSTTSQTEALTPTTTVARPTATPKPAENEPAEMSVAAKAGIVIGALGGILVIFVVLYLVFSARRKKLERQRQQLEDDEKINGPFGDSAAIPATPAKAPRLSLRPVTQFLPFNSQAQADRRASRGIALTLNPVSNNTLSPLNRPAGGSAWERHTVRSPDPNSNRPTLNTNLHPTKNHHHPNPFHDSQSIPEEPVSPVSSISAFSHRDPNAVGLATTTDSPLPAEPVSPVDSDDSDSEPHHQQRHHHHNLTNPPSSLTRKTSIRKDLPQPLDLTMTPKPPSPLYAVPPSPAGTEYSMHSMAPGQSPGPSASAAAIAAAGGPAQSTVHRVQLDFRPTLRDEMELRAGGLVRLLHEYDDGWALCIRLDRSQQGVVPRTCLSTRPVKPRPQPGQQQQRGGPPVNPSFHQHGGGGGSGKVPPLPVPKDKGYGSPGGYGRPRSPGGGGGGRGMPGQAY